MTSFQTERSAFRINGTAVPEPASLVPMGLGILALGAFTVVRRRRRA